MARYCLGFLVLVFLIAIPSCAQTDTPVSYLAFFNDQEAELARDYLDYISAVTHGRSARKLERRRAEVVKTVNAAKQNTEHMKAYKGDNSLRDAYVAYYFILLSVLNEDYGKILNLEEIAEQSYDNMEAYLLAQEKAGEKLDSASKKRNIAYRDFAKRNNIRLIESDSKISQKLEQSGKVTAYYHQVYLVFFKSSKQEYYLIESLNANNVNAVEQNKFTLMKYAYEGLEKLMIMKSFENDYTIVAACRKMLEFYRVEAEKKIPMMAVFYIKNDEFNKTRKIFDSTPPQDRTDADVNTYNKLVNEINNAKDTFNQVNKELNTNRVALTAQWNKASKDFLDSHTR